VADAQTITAGKVVFFHYTLSSDVGETIDSSREGDPMPYLHGAGNIVPGLERQLEGKPVGAAFVAVVSPEEGYGERQGEGPVAVPRDQFPPDAPLQEGMQLFAKDQNDQTFPLWIVKVEEEQVFVDPNHPLADMTLRFDVEVVSMRDASDVEKEHGHPHLPGMHPH